MGELSELGCWQLLEPRRAAIAELLPTQRQRDNVDFFVKVAFAELKKNSYLRTCTPESIVQAVINAARLGLACDSLLGQAYLVPFWSGKRKANECTLIVGYKGLINLALQSGIRMVYARNVMGDDEFRREEGTNLRLIHNPCRPQVGQFMESYAVAVMPKGDKLFEVIEAMELDELKHEQLGKIKEQWARERSPWHTSEAAMRRKTAVRRLASYLPIAPESPLAMAVQLDNLADAGDEQVIDVSAREVPPPEASAADPLKAAAAKAAAKGATKENGKPKGERQPGEDFTDAEKAAIDRAEREEAERLARAQEPDGLF